MYDTLDDISEYRWLKVQNADTANPIPAFSAVRVTGCDVTGMLTVAKPNADSQDVLITGPAPIAAGGFGAATWDHPVWAIFDSSSGTPAAANEQWGAQNSSYKLKKGCTGFLTEGAAPTSPSDAVTRAYFRRNTPSSVQVTKQYRVYEGDTIIRRQTIMAPPPCGRTGAFPYVISIYCDPLLGFVVTSDVEFDIQGVPQNDSFAALGVLTTRTSDTAGVFTFEQQCTAAAVAAGGSGYVVGDVLTVSGGTCATAVKVQVTSVSAGVITAASVVVQGACTAPPANPVSTTGGTGTGATFNLTFTTNPLSMGNTVRFYWPCGYQNVTIGSVSGNTVNFTGSGKALPAASTVITVATVGACC